MGKLKNGKSYRYDDEGEDLMNCKECGCMTIKSESHICTSCEERKSSEEYSKWFDVYLYEFINKGRTKPKAISKASSKEVDKASRKFGEWLEDQLTIHEIMSWRM